MVEGVMCEVSARLREVARTEREADGAEADGAA